MAAGSDGRGESAPSRSGVHQNVNRRHVRDTLKYVSLAVRPLALVRLWTLEGGHATMYHVCSSFMIHLRTGNSWKKRLEEVWGRGGRRSGAFVVEGLLSTRAYLSDMARCSWQSDPQIDGFAERRSIKALE